MSQQLNEFRFVDLIEVAHLAAIRFKILTTSFLTLIYLPDDLPKLEVSNEFMGILNALRHTNQNENIRMNISRKPKKIHVKMSQDAGEHYGKNSVKIQSKSRHTS